MRETRGGGRPGLRIALAFVLFFDVWVLLGRHFLEPPELEQPAYWPHLFYVISQTPWLLWTIAVSAIASIGLFATRRRPIVAGFASLFFIGLLTEAYSSTVSSPRHLFFTAGAVLFGWLAGLVAAKVWKRDDEASERLAEAGAIAGLAATYAGAAIQKLLVGGLFGSSAMRAIVLDHAPYSGGTRELVRTVAENGFMMDALSLATVAVQLGGILMIFGGRLRLFAGLALVGFHLGNLLMLDIIYVEGTFLLLAFAVPWHRLKPANEQMVAVEQASSKAVDRMVACMVGLTAIGALIPTPGPLDGGHSEHWGNEDHAAEEEDREEHHDSDPQVVAVGPLTTQAPLGDWQCFHLAVEPPRLVAAFERGNDVAVFELRPLREVDQSSPLDAPGVHIAMIHREGEGSFEAIGLALQGLILSASDDPGSEFPGWLGAPEMSR